MAELQGRMDAREFAEWLAWHKWLGPLGDEPAYWRTGVIAASIANSVRRKGRRPRTPEDYMPKFRPPRKRRRRAETPAAMWAKITAVFGKVARWRR